MERRESPSGHVRNAMQTLQAVLALGPDAEQLEAVVGAATKRLVLALAEIERLAQCRRSLGREVRSARRGESRPSEA